MAEVDRLVGGLARNYEVVGQDEMAHQRDGWEVAHRREHSGVQKESPAWRVWQEEDCTGILGAGRTQGALAPYHSWQAAEPGQTLAGMLGRRDPCTEGQYRGHLVEQVQEEQQEEEHCQASSGRDCMGSPVAYLVYWLLLQGEIHTGCHVAEQLSLVTQVS